jgi:hypothetical protein
LSSGVFELEFFPVAKWTLVILFPDDPYTLSTVYAKILLQRITKEVSQREMQNEPEKKLDRARLAATKWLPMSAIGAAIPFVIGVIMQLPVEQVLVAAALTSTLVFSGLWMQSYGRERQYRSAA